MIESRHDERCEALKRKIREIGRAMMAGELTPQDGRRLLRRLEHELGDLRRADRRVADEPSGEDRKQLELGLRDEPLPERRCRP